jgi:hypothetical protein
LPQGEDPTTIRCTGRDPTLLSKAQGKGFNVVYALKTRYRNAIASPTHLAQEAAQDKLAYALETLEQLINYIKQVQQQDKAYPGLILQMNWELGVTAKDPSR